MSRHPVPPAFIDDDGHVVGHHSGDGPLDRSMLRPFLHLGTLAQAHGRARRIVTRITARIAPCARLVDRGSNQWPTTRLQPLMRKGCGWAVYLNRHEGIDLDEFLAANARHPGIDDVSDGLFRRLVPSAHDSLILLDPLLVLSVEEIAK